MRLIKVNAPEGKGEIVAKIAFDTGIRKVSIYNIESIEIGGKKEIKEAVDIEASTPKAKQFMDALTSADFFNRNEFSVNIRKPVSIVSSEDFGEITKPLIQPASDITEELWQFSHITYSFVGRVFIASCLLAYGIIESKLLLVTAGLLFLPLLPLLLAIGYGTWTRQFRLAGQGFVAYLTATILLFAGGAAVAAVSKPPVKFDDFNSLTVSFLISLAVGTAAGLANIDDTGKREMIGLAATAQIAVVVVWFGVCTIIGFPATTGENEITSRAISYFLNTLTIIISSLAVYVISGAARRQFS